MYFLNGSESLDLFNKICKIIFYSNSQNTVESQGDAFGNIEKQTFLLDWLVFRYLRVSEMVCLFLLVTSTNKTVSDYFAFNEHKTKKKIQKQNFSNRYSFIRIKAKRTINSSVNCEQCRIYKTSRKNSPYNFQPLSKSAIYHAFLHNYIHFFLY